MQYQMYYNRQGEPITNDEWIKFFHLPFEKSRLVAKDEQDGIEVSTVFLGMNHQFGNGPPLIFETMIFGGEHSDDQWRYATEAEALEGHKAVVVLAFKEATDGD